MVHLRCTVFIATGAWVIPENVRNAIWTLEEWRRITLAGARWGWGRQSDFRFFDSVLEEEIANAGSNALLGFDRLRRWCKRGACQGSVLLLSGVCIDGEAVNVKIFIFRVLECESR